MLLHYCLLLLVTGAAISEIDTVTKGHTLTGMFNEPMLTRNQPCDDEWFMCELHSSGW